MKKILYMAVISAFLPLNLSAQNYWEPTNGPFGGDITSLALDSTNQTVYAGGDGLFYSVNSGENWIRFNNFPSAIIRSISIDQNGQILTATNYGVYRSTNHGESWIISTNNLHYFTSICTNINGSIFAGCGNIYRSTDNGETWELSKSLSESSAIGINSLGHVFVGYSAYHGQFNYEHGIIRSTDNGENWDTLAISYTASSYASNTGGDFFIGTYSNNIYRTTDNGNTWVQLTINLPGINPYDIIVYSLYIDKDGKIYAGINGGLIYSEDNGIIWNFINSAKWYKTVQSILSTSDGHILASTNGRGIFRSDDNGNTWRLSNDGLNRFGITSLAINKNGEIWVGTTSSGIFLSTDYGQSWTNKNEGLTTLEVYEIFICANGNIFTVAGTGYEDAIYRSTDNGNHWVHVSEGLYIYITCITENCNGILFIGTINSGIFKSTDNGDSWITTGELPPYIYFLNMGVFPNNYIIATSETYAFRSTDEGGSWEQLTMTGLNDLLITKTGEIFAGSLGLYYSSDYGDTWELTGLADTVFVFSLAQNSLDYIFASIYGSSTDLTYSKDNRHSWQTLSSNSAPQNLIAFNPEDHLFGGGSNGLFYNLTPTIASFDNYSPSIKTYILTQNYPNPFNPSTTIEYQLPEMSFVTIKVYDILGREVATLVNEEKPMGSYEVQFISNGLTSGIYFYQLKAGDFVETKKMILLR